MKKQRTMLKAFGVILSVLLLATCKDNVALGGAIDINPPTVTITSPAINSKIRNSFTIKGKAGDDGGISAVTVLMEHRDFKVSSGMVNAELKGTSGEWSAVFNRKDENGNFPLPDGSYNVTVLVTDLSGKTAETKTVLEIDNTPPILVLNRPGTLGVDLAANDVDTFGDEIWLDGQSADDSGISKLKVSAYDKNDTSKICEKEEKNVPPTVKIKLDSFRKGPGFYRNLYGKNKTAGRKEYYLGIELWDNAREYDSPDSIAGKSPEEGNYTNVYYLYSPLYNIVFPNYTVDELYSMMNERYYRGASKNEASAKEKEAKRILKGLKEGVLDGAVNFKVEKADSSLEEPQKSKIGLFGLNPVISPLYEIVGFTPKSTGSEDGFKDYLQTQESMITVRISSNTDNVPLAASKEFKYYLFDYESYKKFSGQGKDVNTGVGEDSGAIELQPEKVVPQGSTGYLVSLKLTRENVKVGKTYILQVKGEDKGKNHVIPNDKDLPAKGGGNGRNVEETNASAMEYQYGFKVVGAGRPPVITVKKINNEEQKELNADGVEEAVNITKTVFAQGGEDVKFTVSVVSETYPVEVSYELRKDGKAVNAWGNAVSEDIKKNVEAASDVDFTIKKDLFKEGAVFKSAGYTIVVKAASKENEISVEKQYQIYYDTDAPNFTVTGFENNVYVVRKELPEISGQIYDGVGVGVNFDTFSVSGTFNGTDITSSLSLEKKGSWKLTGFGGRGEGSYVFTFKGADKFANEMNDFTLKFDYDSAAPEILTINNLPIADIEKGNKIIFSDSTFTISGEIKESNGLKKENVKLSLAGEAFSAADSLTYDGTNKIYTFTKNFTSTDNDGERLVKLEVKDNAGKTVSQTGIKVVIDKKDPEFKQMKFGAQKIESFNSPGAVTVNSSTIGVEGEFIDEGSGVKTLTAKYNYNTASQAGIDIPVGYEGGKYVVNYPLNFNIGSTEVTFTLKDGSGKTKEWKCTITVESSVLTLTVGIKKESGDAHYPENEGDTYNGAKYVKNTFKLKVKGESSGASQQSFDLSATKDGAAYNLAGLHPSVTPPIGITVGNEITGFKSGKSGVAAQEYVITFTPQTNGSDDGRYVFTVKSGSVQKEYVVIIDTKGPSITPIEPQAGSRTDKSKPKFKISLFDILPIKSGTIKAHYTKEGGTPQLFVFSGLDTEGMPPADLAEGKYSVYFSAQDNLETTGVSPSVNFFVDKADPELSDLKINGKTDNIVMIKANDNVAVTGKVRDSNSMKKVSIVIKKGSADVHVPAAISISGNTVQNFTFPAIAYTSLSANNGDTYTVYITAEDAAGRTTQRTLTFKVDTAAPVIKDIFPAENTTVNKSITLEGKVSDDVGLDKVTVKDNKGKVDQTFDKNAGFNWSMPIDTTQYTGGGEVIFTITATDLAGNIKQVTHKILVDQETDKPKVTINSFEHLNSAKLAGTRKISGVVEDDDGAVKKVEIKIGGAGYKDADMSAGNTLWSISVPDTVADNPSINFKIKVTDAKDSVFESSDAAPLKQPKLSGEKDTNAIGTDFTFALDTQPPEIKSNGVKYTLGASYGSSEKLLTSGEVVGNENNKKFSVRVFAYDKSQIDSVSLKLGTAAAKAGTHISTSDISEDGKTFEAWDITDIDLTEEGSVKLEITVKDKSGFEKIWSEVIKTDFTKPAITKTAPTDDTVAFEDMTIVGEFADMPKPSTPGIPVAGIVPDSLEYKIGTSDWIKKHEVNGKVLSELTKTGSTWELKINHFPEYKESSLGAVPPAHPSKIWKINLKLKGKDAAGNEVESAEYALQFDPDGSTPMIEILSPHNGDKLGTGVAISGIARTANPAATDKVTKIKLKLRKDGTAAGTTWTLGGKDYGTGVDIVSEPGGINFWSYTLPQNVVTDILNGDINADVFFQVQGIAGGTTGEWTVERKFSISSDVAQFSEIKQDGATYVPLSKWIKGSASHITGEVTHSSGIASATTSSNNLPSGVQPLQGVGTATWFTDISSGKKFDIPIDTTQYSEKAGEIEFTISAKDGRTDGTAKDVFTAIRLKYDNSVPLAAIGEIGLSKYNDKANKADFTGGVFTDFAGVIKDTKHELYTVVVNQKEYTVSSIVPDGSNYKVTLAGASSLNGTGLYYMIVKKYDIISGASFKFEGSVEDSGSGPVDIKAELTIDGVTGVTGKTEAQATSIKNEAGNLYSFSGNLNTSTVHNGKGTLKITVTDGAGNKTDKSIPVRVKNDPLKINKITFNTDLSGNGAYEADSDEVHLPSLPLNALNEDQDYRHTIDVSSIFAYKNAQKSELVIELTGGYGSSRTVKLYKGEVNAAHEVTSGSGTTTQPNVITLNLNGCFANEDEDSNTHDNKIGDKNDQKLILVVTDEVAGDPKPWHAQMDITVAVDVKDDVKPTGYIMPMYYNSKTDNSVDKTIVWDNSEQTTVKSITEHGHIEYSKIASINDHQSLSGKVKLRGIAYDNIRLSKIELTGVDTAVSNTYTSGAWDTSSALKIVSEKITNTGHYVEWEYVWDTGTPEEAHEVTVKVTDAAGTTNAGNDEEPTALTGTREADLKVLVVDKDSVKKGQFISFGEGEALYLVQVTEVTAKDKEPTKEKLRWEKVNGNAKNDVPETLTSGKLYAGTSQKKSEKVNIVPYITALKRPNTYNTHRSSSGAYNLLRGDKVTVEGFNLTGEAKATIPGVAAAVDVKFHDAVSAPPTPAYYGFPLPATAKSGKIEITVGGVKAINNLTNNGKPYNRQKIANRPETQYWTDDIEVHVWKDDEQFEGSGNPKYPSMAMTLSGTLYAAFSNYSKASVYYSQIEAPGQPSSLKEVFHAYDPPEEAAISINNTNDINVLYSANYHGGAESNWNSNFSGAGGLYCYDKKASWFNSGGRLKGWFYRFELFYHNRQLQQFKNFRIARKDSSIHIAYYDTLSASIKYSTVVSNASGYTGNSHEIPWINLDGGKDNDDTGSYTGGNSAVLADGDGGQFETISRAGGTAEYCAIAVDTNRMPVVVYADVDTGTLRLARASSNAPTAAANWKVQKVLPAGDDNEGRASDYFAAQFDYLGYLHIVFRNTRGQICYVKSKERNQGANPYTFDKSVVIAENGSWVELTMSQGIPYVAFLSKINAYDGVQIAYYDENLVKTWNADGTENEKGAWNVMTAAMQNRAGAARACIEVDRNNTLGWKAAVGYTPGNVYRVVKYIGE